MRNRERYMPLPKGYRLNVDKFESTEKVTEAIQTFGEERIKKYYLEVEDD